MEDYSIVSLLPLDVTDEETISDLIYHCDHVIQYGEGKEADEKAYTYAESKLNGDPDAEQDDEED